MADRPMGLLGEDKARREEWRAAHTLLSVSVLVPVPENLTDVKPPFAWKTAPSLPSIPAPPNIIQKEDATIWSKYFFAR